MEHFYIHTTLKKKRERIRLKQFNYLVLFSQSASFTTDK